MNCFHQRSCSQNTGRRITERSCTLYNRWFVLDHDQHISHFLAWAIPFKPMHGLCDVPYVRFICLWGVWWLMVFLAKALLMPQSWWKAQAIMSTPAARANTGDLWLLVLTISLLLLQGEKWTNEQNAINKMGQPMGYVFCDLPTVILQYRHLSGCWRLEWSRWTLS